MTPRTWIVGTPETRDRLAKFLARLPVEETMEVSIRPYTPRRSSNQNARLWLLHTKASEVTGYTPEDMHELMLCKFFGTQEIEVGGVRRIIPLKRSSQRDRKEFADYMTAVEAFYASELGVWLE